MKLNYDCLRKILLIIEKELNWDDDLKYKYTNLSSLCDNLKDFSRAEIAYASSMAIEADLINAKIIDCDACIIDIRYFGLTYEGHQFLDTIRENKVWKKTKDIVSSAGGASLAVIKEIGTSFLTDLLKSQLH